MAEWIKFEVNLPEKPETLAITSAMGWDDPDLTVGKLMRMFRWFDQQTTDGNATRVTPALLDRLLGVSGLTMAVASVGWIHVTEAGISLEKFDRHNGNSAKQRALTAQRVAKHKANAVGNAEGNAGTVTKTVSDALPRKEKKRKEVDINLDGFEDWYSQYPKKLKRAEAEVAWSRMVDADRKAAMDALPSHVALQSWNDDGGQYIPYPASWLNGKRWQDELQSNVYTMGSGRISV